MIMMKNDDDKFNEISRLSQNNYIHLIASDEILSKCPKNESHDNRSVCVYVFFLFWIYCLEHL